MNHINSSLIGTSFLIALTSVATAEIQMPAFFSDKMVLQQETAAKVWGSADANQKVKVSFAGQSLTTSSNAEGKWRIEFTGLKASKNGSSLTIEAGKDTHAIHDVLVGEVWLASGQSNMEWKVSGTASKPSIATDNDDLLRVYVSGNTTSAKPSTDFPGTWKATKPENTGSFTAVGYEFAKSLREKLDVPVGVIECSWGGKPVQSFISDEALKACPEAKPMLDHKSAAVSNYDPAKAKENYEARMKKWKVADAQWKTEKKGKRPREPRKPRHPALAANMPSAIYNGMIAPLVGYGSRGAIWYQGESNARGSQAMAYGELLECLIQDWRKRWGTNLSFYYVQLANFEKWGDKQAWVNVQDEMRRLLDDSNSKTGHIGMATINDIGAPMNIHPKNKKDVGQRLARWALNQDYGMKDVVVSGPLYKSHGTKGNAVIVEFDHANGLKSRDGKALGSFEIAGADNQWKPAQAMIAGNTVVVRNKDISKPTQARYAWKINPTAANLVNGEGLPTSCFTTP
ncbi:MAG: sialate O-acetylesterase [Verrucomicrobiae bacterium]|nr:sialate O-acetylesterase [Verrucomicrobiae bacterium]NNJ41791.1 sialate O-acetylesterase [Akkermansiaceae bacterium]